MSVTAFARKLARQEAFEATVDAAGERLQRELAAAGDDREARRAAWQRYGDAQEAAGAEYRRALSAEEGAR